MQRPAETQYPLHDLLKTRWSPVAFDETSLTDEQIGSLLEAARWAPSSYNAQPWSFILARRADRAEFERLLSCLVEPNQVWARHSGLLMITVARKEFERNGKPNAHARYDVGQAAALMTVQAAALGLHVHQMAGFLPDRARELYAIPETHEPVSAIAIGHYGQNDVLPAEVGRRDESPRERRPLREQAFAGRWGTPIDLTAK